MSKHNKYKVILADPPWKYDNNGNNGAAEKHYSTMKIDDICKLPIADLADKDCILYLWATWPMLVGAMQVIEAWQFKYITGLPWIKSHSAPATNLFGEIDVKLKWGTGYWFRSCSEVLLLCRRGKPPLPDPPDVMLGLIAPTLKHSRKPDDVYELAKQHEGPRLELFARRQREGWDAFGNEVEGSIKLGVV